MEEYLYVNSVSKKALWDYKHGEMQHKEHRLWLDKLGCEAPELFNNSM